MTVLEVILIAKVAGTAASIVGGIDVALRRFCKCTAEDLFKKCFVAAVKRNASNLANLTATADPKSVEVDNHILERRIASLKDIEISTITSLEEEERLAKITALFRDCIILPNHQLTDFNLDQRIRPVLVETIADFYNKLPLNQEAFNQIVLEFIQDSATNQIESFTKYRTFLEEFAQVKLGLQEHLAAIKENTSETKEKVQTTLDIVQELKVQTTNSSNRNINAIIADVVATEHLSEIDNARDLLNKGMPHSALEILEKLRNRIWQGASSHAKFRILTNMGIAHLVLNKEQEAAKLLIEAFQYNRDDELALSNIASAHFLLGNTAKAEDYAKKTLEMNEANTSAYAILVGISEKEETLDEVISKVPKYLRDMPQIAQAISEEARQRCEFEQAIKWGEITVACAQDEVSNRKAAWKAALARILVEQITNDRSAMFTQQLGDSHKEPLKQAVELFTEAWNSVDNTETRTVVTDWIIWKSTALDLLGDYTAAIEAINTAIKIEPDYPVLYMKRALLALKQRDYHGSIGFLETIQSAPETPEAPILLANILFVIERIEEAITKLNDFLMTDPEAPLREDANRLLIKAYVTRGDFDKAQEISTAMRESSPTNVLFLVDAARIAKANDNNDEALSRLEEAYGYAQSSEVFLEISELANELLNYKEFGNAVTLYEKIADTHLNSQWTMCLLESYYHAGERKKALEICRSLREKYGPLERVTAMEFLIYNEIGDMNQARAVGEMYVNAFPSDIEMQIRLGVILLRSNHFEELDRLLETPFDVRILSLRASFDLAHLNKVRSKPETALDIMYEARRVHYEDAEAHLKYIGLFYQVDMELEEELNPNTIEPGTAVCVENDNQKSWYIIEERDDADFVRREISTHHSIARRLLGKHLNEEVCLTENPLGPEIWKITDIKSKYVHAFQEILHNFSGQFPESKAMWKIKLEDSQDSNDSDRIRPLLKFVDMNDEASIRVKNIFKETPLPIGAFSNVTGRNFLDTWQLLRSDSNLGVRCSSGNTEESRHALTLLKDRQLKLIVEPISLMTIHGLGAADTIIEAVGKLGIARSTIDELQQIINGEQSMWYKRERMHIGKEDNEYVRGVITPEDTKQSIEYLESIMAWIGENCNVLPCNAALKMNRWRKQELDDKFQEVFVDSMLIASEPGNLLLSDDELLRSYAKTNLGIDAGTHFQVDGVWTQVLLKHCLDIGLLDRSEYDKMTIKLICSNYYHTFFDADLVIEAAKQSDWNASEPYSTVVRTLGNQNSHLLSALHVSVDFLFKLWIEAIPLEQREHLTLQLFGSLTSGRSTREVLNLLASAISERFTLNPLAEQDILSLIEIYVETHPL